LRKGIGERCLAEANQPLRNPDGSRRFCPAMYGMHPLGREYFGILSSHSIGRKPLKKKVSSYPSTPNGCGQLGYSLVQVGDQAVIGDLKDVGVGVGVDGHDRLGLPDAYVELHLA